MVSFEKRIKIDEKGRETEIDIVCLQAMDACLILNLYGEVYLKQNIPSNYLENFKKTKEIMGVLYSEKEKKEYSYLYNGFPLFNDKPFFNFKKIIKEMEKEGTLLTRESLFELEEDELKVLVESLTPSSDNLSKKEKLIAEHKRNQYRFALEMKRRLRARKANIDLCDATINPEEQAKLKEEISEERGMLINFGLGYLLEDVKIIYFDEHVMKKCQGKN